MKHFLLPLFLAGCILALPSARALTFPEWQAATFSASDLANPARSSESADPDGDGCCNLLEYAFGNDPLAPDFARPALESGSDGFALITPESLAPSDLLLRLEVSADLAEWRWITPNPASREILADDGMTRIVRFQVPIGADATGRGFARLRVTLAPDTRDGLFPPTALTATLSVPLTTTLLWNDNARVEDGYAIERRAGAGGAWEEIGETASDANLFDDISLAGSTDYTYRVAAIQGGAASEFSNEITLTTPLDTDQDGIPDADEAAFGVDALKFSTGNNGAPDGWWIRHELDPFSPTSQDTDGDGRPDAQEFLDGTDPLVADAAPNPGSAAPLAPSLLTVATVESGAFQLDWANNDPSTVAFLIERTDNAADWKTVGVVPASKTTFTDTATAEGVGYFYRVIAHN